MYFVLAVTIGTVWAVWVHARSAVPHKRGDGASW